MMKLGAKEQTSTVPYQSRKQSAYIHMMASQGVPWAQRWVRENHGQNVKKLPTYKGRKRARSTHS